MGRKPACSIWNGTSFAGVAAGLEMLRELRQLNQQSHHGDLVLKIGVHRGHVLMNIKEAIASVIAGEPLRPEALFSC
jgi:hypothetical protein